ncbi:hypothetical protein DFR50_11870 [Roseiarcus fermentans]|uniref:Uncharacterized protein n=1 Tax=Roseiarcus fermentans TaxID=1473586 RepID=A0A366F7G4_9HYPH|nr:hypothetical protein [Roseiarcus fermentans]RBP10584.1 hypothetical protein DFR50_11870 [Roseiarcus fermentans]
MGNWNVDYWPWGGVKICLDEQETKNVFSSADAATTITSALGAIPPPVSIAAAVVGLYIGLEKSAAEAADQGGGVCFELPWVAIYPAENPLLVIPSSNGSPSPPFQGNKQQHVNYAGSDGKVHELWFSDTGGWSHNILSDIAHGGADSQTSLPASGSAVDGFATWWNKQQHVNYIGKDGKVHELWFSDNGGWSHNVLSDAAPGANGQTSLPVAGSPLDGYTTLWNNQQHVNYIGNDGKVHELWFSDNGGWSHNVLSDAAPGANGQISLPVSGSPLDGFETPWNKQQHVNYIGKDGKVHELWFSDNGGWSHNVLSDAAHGANGETSLPVAGSPLDGFFTPWNSQQHVNYIGKDGKVHELWFSDNGGWSHNVLSDAAPGANGQTSLPVAGSPLDGYVTPWNNQQHVNYVGRDGKVHELWFSDNGGWSHNILSDAAPGANGQTSVPLAGSPLDGFFTPWNNQQHVNYIGRDGKVHELWFSDNGGWSHNVLSDAAPGADSTGDLPAPMGYIDGYIT